MKDLESKKKPAPVLYNRKDEGKKGHNLLLNNVAVPDVGYFTFHRATY